MQNLLRNPCHVEHIREGVVSIRVECEFDYICVHRELRAMAQSIGFAPYDVIKLLTISLELTQNMYHYAGKGIIRIASWRNSPKGICIEAIDKGPGIAHIDQILNGGYRSSSGMGLGLLGCRNIMDTFDIKTSPQQGTHITVTKYTSQ